MREKLLPLRDALLAQLAADQALAQRYGAVLSVLFIGDADSVTFGVIDQRQIVRGGKGTFGKFDRRAHIQQRHIVEEQCPQVVDFLQVGSRHLVLWLGCSCPRGGRFAVRETLRQRQPRDGCQTVNIARRKARLEPPSG